MRSLSTVHHHAHACILGASRTRRMLPRRLAFPEDLSSALFPATRTILFEFRNSLRYLLMPTWQNNLELLACPSTLTRGFTRFIEEGRPRPSARTRFRPAAGGQKLTKPSVPPETTLQLLIFCCRRAVACRADKPLQSLPECCQWRDGASLGPPGCFSDQY